MSPRCVPAPDEVVLASMRARIDEVFDRVIGDVDRVAILHFPYDGNVGNHMMYLAIADYLRERRIAVAYAAHAGNLDLDALGAAIGTAPILFLGGVTVSRLWPEHADTKRRIAARFRANRLVGLTSTMTFVDESDAEDARGIFGDHERVVLLAREAESARQAQAAFGHAVEIVTVDDSALRLGPMQVGASPSHDVLWLRRDDVEGLGHHVPDGVHVFDWPALSDPMYRAAYYRMRACGVATRLRQLAGPRTPGPVNRGMAAGYHAVSRRVVRAGAEYLATGRVLVTDRMHPHILSAMIGQPVVLLPDRYGKNRSVFEHSTSALSTVHWADDANEGFDLAVALARTGVATR